MRKMNARGWAVLGGLILSGCAHQQVAKMENVDPPYRIGREDVLEVAVWRDPDLTRTLPVRPDGFISMPMVGEVKAEGMTPTELQSSLQQSLKAYVQEPKVTVLVREVNSSRVFVTGEVARPGAFPLRGRVSLVQAIALAGGFTDFANEDGIIVLRADSKGQKIPVRYSDLVDADDSDRRELFLRPGDTIVVP